TSLGDTGALGIESTSLVEPTAEPTLDFVMPGVEDAAASAEPSGLDEPLVMPDAAASLELPDAPIEEIALDISMPADVVDVAPAAKSIDSLHSAVDKNPEDWAAHRTLAEALLEEGKRDDGIRSLETAMLGFERANDLGTAMSVADEIVRIDPSSVKHHQKKVEYAYRSNDRGQLVESYLALADALFRSGQVDKSRSIYQRVLELSPDDIRAQAAISAMPTATPEAPKLPPAAGKKT